MMINNWDTKLSTLKRVLARGYSKLFSPNNQIAIMGSDGKTTTALLIERVLQKKFPVISSVSSSGESKDIDGLVFRLKNDKKTIVVWDLQHLSDPGEWLKFFRPVTLILTNISQPQGEFQGNLIEAIKAYKKVINALGNNLQIVANYDDSNVRSLVDEYGDRVIYFGSDSKHCHVWFSNMKIENLTTKFEINYGVERVEISSQLLGFQQIYPQMAAAAIAINLGIPLTTIKNVFEQFLPLPSRMQVLPGVNGASVIDDSWQMSPSSTIQAIDCLNFVSAKKRLVMLSAVTDLGSSTHQFNHDLAFKLQSDKVDFVFLLGEEAKDLEQEMIKLGFNADRIEYQPSYNQIIDKVLKVMSRGDVLLIKLSGEIQRDQILGKLTRNG